MDGYDSIAYILVSSTILIKIRSFVFWSTDLQILLSRFCPFYRLTLYLYLVQNLFLPIWLFREHFDSLLLQLVNLWFFTYFVEVLTSIRLGPSALSLKISHAKYVALPSKDPSNSYDKYLTLHCFQWTTINILNRCPTSSQSTIPCQLLKAHPLNSRLITSKLIHNYILCITQINRK